MERSEMCHRNELTIYGPMFKQLFPVNPSESSVYL